MTTAQLQEGIRALTRRLKDEVSHRQPELLQQAVSLRHAEDAMQVHNLLLGVACSSSVTINVLYASAQAYPDQSSWSLLAKTENWPELNWAIQQAAV